MQLAGVSAGLLPAKVTVGDLTATRDFIDVRDVALALQTLIEKGSPGLAYNVGSGLETSISTVLDNLVSIAELDGRLEIPEYLGPPSAIRRQFADVGRLANLGFCCTYKLRESLREAFLYYTNTVSSVGG